MSYENTKYAFIFERKRSFIFERSILNRLPGEYSAGAKGLGEYHYLFQCVG